MKDDLRKRLGLIFLVTSGAIAFGDCTLAQIVPDSTLGTESSVVETNVVINGIPSTQIDGKAIRGSNLFHSFQEFNIGEGQSVYFTNPPEITNIFSRVTGSNRSEILGKLGVLGNANLFLLNPNGIIFGSQASLDLNGSFFASTASSVNFANGTQFNATTSQTSPLLTVSVPIGLQFGNTAASIVVQESRRGIDPSFRLIGSPGKTLGLVGGDITLEGAYLEAPGGRIELGSVDSNSLVSLNPTAQGWTLGYQGIQNFQNIQLAQGRMFASEVISSGEDGGNIQVQGRQVLIAGSSQIRTDLGASQDGSQIRTDLGASQGGNLTVTASESVNLIGDASSLLSQTSSDGKAGNIIINTARLLISDGAFISVASVPSVDSEGQSAIPTGQAGTLTVNASESVELKSGLIFSSTQGSGNAGSITINTARLLIEDGIVNVSSGGMGQAGILTVNASELVELKSSLISSSTQGSGNAGNITINTAKLLLEDGAVDVSSGGTGDGGNLEISANSILLSNQSRFSAETQLGTGGGNITLRDVELLQMRNTSRISSTALGSGRGGNITINADILVGLENSDITANSLEAQGGLIDITTQEIFGLAVRETSNIAEMWFNNTSDISAASQDPQLNGEVRINRTEVDPKMGLVTLPTTVIDVANLVAQGCSTDGNVASSSEFIITGRGGLPPTPREVVTSEAVLADLGTPIQDKENRPFTTISSNQNTLTVAPIVEAQGWVVNKKGEVILTAQAPDVTPHIPWLTPNCNVS